MLEGITKGDHIKFNVKIKSLGNEFRLHHAHLLDGDIDGIKTMENTGHTKDLDHVEQHDVKLP